jgi:hypothetical protein
MGLKGAQLVTDLRARASFSGEPDFEVTLRFLTDPFLKTEKAILVSFPYPSGLKLGLEEIICSSIEAL